MPNVYELLIGVGVIGMLFQISRQLGCIKNELKHVVMTQNDHEKRLRKLEQS